MPRKVNYALDYGEDYDIYDDYDDYDYDHGLGDGKPSQSEKISEPEKMIGKSGLWQCSVCTYDNDDSSLHCDICGVLREPSINSGGDLGGKGKPSQSEKISKPEKMIGKSGLWQCSVCTYENDESSLHCDICGVLREPSINSGGDLGGKASAMASSSTNGKKRVHNGKVDNSSTSLSKVNYLNENKNSMRKENKDRPSRDSEDKLQMLGSNLDNLKLDKNSTNTRKVNSRAQYKPENWMSLDQEHGTLNQLNLAIVGHVDSGKSTLSGRLLHLLGRISKKEMHKYEKEAKEKGKGSFAYAWAMDESTEERERGITMTVAVAYFDSKKYRVVLLDSPGHKDFVPNMISGATQADAAILVVDAAVGSFEAGMDGNGFGQTKEHAQLIRSFGVEQIIVAVNKMDAVGFSKERFEYINLQLGSFLRSCGFKESSVTWIPISAMENQNLVTSTSDMRLSCWYKGLCLLDAIDSLQPPLRDVSMPLRLPICDVTKSNLGQVAACGKLEAGAIRNGSKVLVLPLGDLATVRSIERDSCACRIARAGDNVAVNLQGIDWVRVMPGGVLCHPDFPVAVATSLELKILVLDIVTPILIGSQVEFHIHHAKEAARVVRILSLLDPKTGMVSKKSPRFLKAKQSAIIEVALDGAVCVEEFTNCRALGRAFLRSSGSTIAVGVVTRVLEQET